MGISYGVATQVRSGVERATLVRRTYALVFGGVIVTMFGTAFALTQAGVMQAVIAHPFITFLCSFAPLMMAQAAPRAFPRNIILTLLFTFLTGVYLAPVLTFYAKMQPGAIGEAGLLTFTTFGALTLYATVSRRDFSAWRGFFVIGLCMLFVCLLINSFLQNVGISLWLAGCTVFVFGGLLVFDTWRIMRSGQLGPDDYVIAAVSIYLDLLNIFLALLELLGGRGRR